MSNYPSNLNLGQEALWDYLTQGMNSWGAKVQIQYSDYSEDTWTVPELLTENKINQIITDYSVKNIRLIFQP